MRFLLDIQLGNEAMQTPDDVRHALHRNLPTNADSGEPFALDGIPGTIFDDNGNRVGSWRVVDVEAEARADAEALDNRGRDPWALKNALAVLVLDPAIRAHIDPKALAQARAALGLEA